MSPDIAPGSCPEMVLERPETESSVVVDSGSRHIARPSVAGRAEHMQRSGAQVRRR